MISNPDSLGLPNPETSRDWLDHEEANRCLDASQAGRNRLVTRAEDNHPRRARRIVAACVGKIRIEGDQHAPLALARRLDGAVVRAGQAFLVNVVHVPALLLKPLARRPGQVLVELELHAALGRDR